MRVLIADSSPRRAVALSDVLSADAALSIMRPEPGMALLDAVRALQPDIVLVDLDRADRDALDSVRVLAGSGTDRPIALFVDQDDEALMREAFDAGVCSYNVIETLPRDVKPLLRAAIALFGRFQAQARALSDAQRNLSERETIDRAKRLFMKSENTNEAAAHRWFQKRAMQEGRRVADICRHYLDRNAPGPKS